MFIELIQMLIKLKKKILTDEQTKAMEEVKNSFDKFDVFYFME